MSKNDLPQVRAKRKSPERFHHGQLAESLVALAEAIVDAEGHEAVSTKRLATALGVSEPAIYRHFASKNDLLAMVVARWFVMLDAATAAALASSAGDHAARVAGAGRAYVEVAVKNRHRFRMVNAREWNNLLADRAPNELAPYSGEGRMALRRAIADLTGVDHTQLGGLWTFDVPVVDDLYRTLWAFAHGLAVLVAEHGFMLARTDEERMKAAEASIVLFEEMLRRRWGAR